MKSEFQTHNKSLFSVPACPGHRTGHACSSRGFVVDLKFTFDRTPRLALANSGSPVGSRGWLAPVSLPRGAPRRTQAARGRGSPESVGPQP